MDLITALKSDRQLADEFSAYMGQLFSGGAGDRSALVHIAMDELCRKLDEIIIYDVLRFADNKGLEAEDDVKLRGMLAAQTRTLSSELDTVFSEHLMHLQPQMQ
ncbi:MAG: hypothetical protein IKR73_05790 [Oscillospiraceae bacterium]|nr:hypothetical protein [Oscillospiraceae bacterium]